jgi:hypothetical protein
MHKQFGGPAFLLVILSAFVSNIGGVHFTSKDKAATGTTSSKTPDAQPPEAIEEDTHKCAVAEILRRHYGQSEQRSDKEAENRTDPDHICEKSAFDTIPFDAEPGKQKGLVLIATVPDPLQSANALEFDRDIEALQEAASTSHYDFESMVTEWDISDLEEPKDAKGGREAEHYRRAFGDQPGAMLFHKRSYSNGDLLLLILVPESSTYGLNMHAAIEALSAISILKTMGFSTSPVKDCDNITWIGPNYSASVYGLQNLSQGHPQFDAFSGSITSSPSIGALKTIDQKSCRPNDEVTAPQPDENALAAVWSSGILGRGGEDHIVLLQEDESTYGGGSLQSDMTTFHFPRGISHIRGIFGNQLTNFKPPSDEGTKSQDALSPFDLADTLQQPLDTAPEFAAQSPYSNEGVLAAIASSIIHLHAEAIVILATDPLDELFLARYYHQKIPDARLVLLNAERLLPGLRQQYNLDGTLAVTRFPLFEGSYLQTSKEARHTLTFMNSTQEGIFFAALHQISPGKIFEKSTSDQPDKLPTWIGISSGDSFWPIKRIDSSSHDCHSGATANDFIVNDIADEPLPQLWFICTFLALLFAVVHIVFFLAAQPFNHKLRNGSAAWAPFARHRILTFYLSCDPKTAHSPEVDREFGRRYWLLGATTQLLLVLNYLMLPAASLLVRNHDMSLFTWTFWPIAAIIYVASHLLFLYLTCNLIWFCLTPPPPPRPAHPLTHLIWPFGTFIWWGLGLTILVVNLVNSSNGYIFAVRCVHLTSGVSPVVPLLLASLGFITAGIVNLNALALARDRNPQIPDAGIDMLRIAPCQEKLTSYIESWGFLPNPQGSLLFFLVLATCLIADPFRIFGSLDGALMTWLFVLNVVFGLWTIFWLWARFLTIWSLLRFVLEALEGSPLRFAFSRLPKIFSLAPIWSYAGLRRTLILPMRWFEYFRVTPKLPNYARHLEDERAWLNRVSDQLRNNQVLIDGDYILFSKDQNKYAALLADAMPAIEASWEQGGPDAEIGDSGSAKNGASNIVEHDGIKSRNDVPVPCGTDIQDNCQIAIANEYIAMRFGAYVRYVTLQLKNLMTFMSIGLLLLLLATISYPFRQPESIAWILVVLVFILFAGVGTVLVQMDRDSILSRMSETPPGEVARGAFLWHMLSVGGLPVITALSALFPSVGKFLFSWLQPLLATLH